ncbi:hypothetical protein BCR34DRAFT_615467 [Clohesyomyces aquaticus]|uniref:Uncharacterized protein n=1 Tax=Clohesyomyces aquaticus TaxID=1231657 RepID=A0A1Y1ZIG6_9PLEO|nr:hypothetical protein BCR34DRAFT_615467 [Clohesyomyces aquaticus]
MEVMLNSISLRIHSRALSFVWTIWKILGSEDYELMDYDPEDYKFEDYDPQDHEPEIHVPENHELGGHGSEVG